MTLPLRSTANPPASQSLQSREVCTNFVEERNTAWKLYVFVTKLASFSKASDHVTPA